MSACALRHMICAPRYACRQCRYDATRRERVCRRVLITVTPDAAHASMMPSLLRLFRYAYAAYGDIFA